MEFLVEFDIRVPEGTPESEVAERELAEAGAAAKLEDEGHLVRVWKRPLPTGETTVLGLYRADTETELHALLRFLPLYQWMQVTVTPLEAHPNDPAAAHASPAAAKPVARVQLPDPQVTLLYRLEATLGEPLDLSRGFRGRRRADVDPARIPPGQYVTADFPVLSAGPTPDTALELWDFSIVGELDEPRGWTWKEFRALPSEETVMLRSILWRHDGILG